VAGAGYARMLLAALARYWPDAVAGATIRFHMTATSILIGISAALLCALLIVLGTLWRGTRQSPRKLLTTDFSSVPAVPTRGKYPWFLLLPSSALVFALAIAAQVWITHPGTFVEPFFTVGTLLLLAAFGYYAWLLMYLARRPAFKQPRLWKMAVTNLARRRGRSLSVAALTACGCFLVFSVASMQENLALHAGERSSGTGGFALFAETTVPIVAAPEEISKLLKVDAVPLRVRDGDDAGCLNLNRAQTPRLFGVDPQMLANLGAFTAGPNARGLWAQLEQETVDGSSIPAVVGDINTALWGLRRKVDVIDGALLPYPDESGAELDLKLVGQLPMSLSVFQGSLLISDSAFTRLFPSEAGFRAFLIDAPPEQALEIAARLNREFERFGMQAVPAVQRLREFYAVEATYLAMFLLLGGLALILGAGGAGIVVLRSVFERRAEVALLHAVGYRTATVFRIFFLEHGLLVLAGMAMGTLAAAASILPLVLFSQTSTVSATLQAALLAFIAMANLLSVAVVLLAGLPRDTIAALREE
jgi:hypothetical protein